MNSIKKLILISIIFVLLFSAIPLYATGIEPGKNISRWGEYEILDSERYGIYSWEWYKEDLRKPLSKDKLESILSDVEFKLMPVDCYINTSFKKIDRGDIETREGFLKGIYNLIGIYEADEINKLDTMEYLKNIGILKGDGKSFHLEDKITGEEAIIFSKRAIDYIYTKKNFSSKGIMWEVNKKGNKVYLLGSLDVGSDLIYPFKKEIIDRFESSDKYVVHVNLLPYEDIENPEGVYNSDGSTLESKIGKEVYGKYKSIMEAFKVEEKEYKNMKPWAALLTLESLVLTGEDEEFTSQHNIAYYLALKSKASGKEILELEGLDYQYSLLDEVALEEQVYLLEEEVTNVLHEGIDEEIRKESMERKLQAWQEGDKNKLKELIDRREDIEDINEVLLKDRDKNISKKISELLEGEDKKTYFIVLDSIHFLNEGTIIDDLKAMGYKVEYLK